MKIIQKDTDRYARKFPYRDKAEARYRVFPEYRYKRDGKTRRNSLQEEVAFALIEDAAAFLVRHKGSAIRMDPDGVIITKNICIDFDAKEPTDAEDAPEEDKLEVEE